MKDSECTHVQCPRCFQEFCWACLSKAKGQKHFKENPGCKSLDGVFQLDFITQQMKDEGAITEYNDYVNLKFCARCPGCNQINEKKTKCNAISCLLCKKPFCYICNKSISGQEHYQGAKSLCHLESEHWNDL